jgi:Rrf2 family protein
MLTMKGKYGLKAVMDLARLPEGDLALSVEIARRNVISKKFLDVILNDLRMAGLVVARKGRGGGYRLARRPEKVMVGEVLRVLDGPIAPLQCASRATYQPCHDCPDEDLCAVRLTMIDVRDAISSVLDQRSVLDLVLRIDAIGEHGTSSLDRREMLRP